ncbi:hypothetical protein GE061_016565 [Apolygus lucorum]|uniref:MADF domain-containing protein n=1 Tax=Apolygus lucorum TaxID=248454 RepID=A0A8S9XKL0_APOLU|nr:hypothetical protein GE061_016565 [Apolygus lucorum]
MSICDQFLVSRLIELIKLNRCIYDPRQEHHNNRGVINSVWKCIATEMGQPETLCREKWINLRSNFARELRKTRRKMCEDGGKQNNTSQWIHFESMMFLAPFVKTRLATAEPSSDIEEVRIKLERDPISIDPHSPPFFAQEDSEPACFEFVKKRKYEEDIDDDKMFLLSLLPKMKQLPVLDNMSFRIEVHTLLLSKLQSCLGSSESNGRSIDDYRQGVLNSNIRVRGIWRY